MLILEFISDRKLPAEDLLIWSDDLLGLERIRKFRMILEDDTRECCTVGARCRLLFAAMQSVIIGRRFWLVLR